MSFPMEVDQVAEPAVSPETSGRQSAEAVVQNPAASQEAGGRQSAEAAGKWEMPDGSTPQTPAGPSSSTAEEASAYHSPQTATPIPQSTPEEKQEPGGIKRKWKMIEGKMVEQVDTDSEAEDSAKAG